MANLLVNERDQEFVLFEMLNYEDELCSNPKYEEYTRDLIHMSLNVARKLAVEEIYPALTEGDREGCTLLNGEVRVPKSFHRIQKLVIDGGWNLVSVSQEFGGQGFPFIVNIAIMEYFIHNFSYFCYLYGGNGAGHLIEVFGNEEQKKKYMEKMYSGLWGGTMALTEPDAGSDVGNLSTKAVKQPDGTYRITGNKLFITGGDCDLFENIIHPVLARIEGDPAGTKGISIFLIPKYIVNDDGTPGERNDYTITGIEHKMGINGSATCAMSFGDNGNCYAELLGEERKGMRVMFQLMNEARITVGLQGLGTASAAYLHALNYSRERIQGNSIKDIMNPQAPKVPIIEHPDVRRMLIWMKSHVEGMRAFIYYLVIMHDRSGFVEDNDEKEKLEGLLDILTPICKSYCSDMGFRVTETAIQVYGGYGYTKDYPVEQFMRDLKIASIYEGTNGIQALDLVGRKLGEKGGSNFIHLLSEMNSTVEKYGKKDGLKNITECFKSSVDLLTEMGGFLAAKGKEGRFMIPVTHATPFLNMMGNIIFGWMLYWQAGISVQKLEELYSSNNIDAGNKDAIKEFLKNNKEAAFYSGKLISATFYINNVLPGAESIAKSIKSEDLSPLKIDDEGF